MQWPRTLRTALRALYKFAAAKGVILHHPSWRDLAADWADDAWDSKRPELRSTRPADQVAARQAIWRVDVESVAIDLVPRRWPVIQADGAVEGPGLLLPLRWPRCTSTRLRI